MQLKLIVIRSPDPKKLTSFYEMLGLVFDYHKHGIRHFTIQQQLAEQF